MTLGRQLVESVKSEKGIDIYSQPWRYRPGYSDCSSYMQRKCKEFYKIDIGSYTTAIYANATRTVYTKPDGTLFTSFIVTESLSDLRAGRGMVDGDIVLWGWKTDHRAGYPMSHVGVYDAMGRGTWDQYGDLPPFTLGPDGRNHGRGPSFHSLSLWADKADRCRVIRFIPYDSPVFNPPTPTPVTQPTNQALPKIEEDGAFGRESIGLMQLLLGTPLDKKISAGYSQAVAALQKLLLARGRTGYDGKPLVVDGEGLGSNVNGRYPAVGRRHTVYALQQELGIKNPDGVLDAYKSQTILLFQKRMNTGKI